MLPGGRVVCHWLFLGGWLRRAMAYLKSAKLVEPSRRALLSLHDTLDGPIRTVEICRVNS